MLWARFTVSLALAAVVGAVGFGVLLYFGVVVLFEALYYIPSAEKFAVEAARVLRPGGVLLIATANRDLYDFAPSPHSFTYYGAREMAALLKKAGFELQLYCYLRTDEVSLKQRLLRPLKAMAVKLNLIPQTMAGKRLLKRLVYLSLGLAVILAFIGVKLVLEAVHENSLPFINGGEPVHAVPAIPIWLSLTVILGVLVVATVASLLKTRGALPAGKQPEREAQQESAAQPETTAHPDSAAADKRVGGLG